MGGQEERAQTISKRFVIKSASIRSSKSIQSNTTLKLSQALQNSKNVLTVKDINQILDTPVDRLNNIELENIVETLMQQITGHTTQFEEESQGLKAKSQELSSWKKRIEEAKCERKALVEAQELMRKELLDLGTRVDQLDEFRKILEATGPEMQPGATRGSVQKLKKSIQKNIAGHFVSLGLKEALTKHKKTELNDQEVMESNQYLKNMQVKYIDELNKYSLINLKKPKYVLLMDRILK
jgi:hypothetical protein